MAVYDGYLYCVAGSMLWEPYSKIYKVDIKTFAAEFLTYGDALFIADEKLYFSNYRECKYVISERDLKTDDVKELSETDYAPEDFGMSSDDFGIVYIPAGVEENAHKSQFKDEFGTENVFSYVHINGGYIFADSYIDSKNVYFLRSADGKVIRLNLLLIKE